MSGNYDKSRLRVLHLLRGRSIPHYFAGQEGRGTQPQGQGATALSHPGRHAGTPRLQPTRRSSQKAALIPVAILCLFLAGCPSSVTYHDQPVTGYSETIARTIRVTDIAAAAAGQFLIAAYQNQAITRDVFSQYANDIGPAVQLALDESREALKVYLDTRGASTTLEALQAAFGELAAAAERLAVLARDHGWGG